jgi:hypothetical protein
MHDKHSNITYMNNTTQRNKKQRKSYLLLTEHILNVAVYVFEIAAKSKLLRQFVH